MAIQTRIAPVGVAAPLGGLDEVADGGVADGMVDLGDVADVGAMVLVRAPVDVGIALLVAIDGFTVLVEVLIDVAITDGDADPPVGAWPQPTRTSPTEVKADSSTDRLVQGLLDDSLPMSTQ